MTLRYLKLGHRFFRTSLSNRREIWGRSLFLILCLTLIVGNIILQITMQQDGLDDQPVNSYSPSRSDANEYVHKAETVAKSGDFVQAFKNGTRVPGYPLFLSIFYRLSDRPLLMARYAQIVLSSLAILFSYLAFVNIVRSKFKAILGASIIALWVPFYYFSPILIAESCSIFLFSVLFYILSKLGHRSNTVITYSLPVLLALLVYLKPNHALLLVPVLAFLWFKVDRFEARYSLVCRHSVLVIVLFIGMLIPWVAFSSVMNGEIVLLSTTSGKQLFLGTGVYQSNDSNHGSRDLSELAARRLGLGDYDIPTLAREDFRSLSLETLERDTSLEKVAVDIWLSHPVEMSLYGLSKVLHGFGFSLRDLRDVLLVMLLMTSFVSSVYLWVSGNHREWCIFYWAILGVAALQMFVFFPNQRFKTVFFDLPAMMMIIGTFQIFDQLVYTGFVKRLVSRLTVGETV